MLAKHASSSSPQTVQLVFQRLASILAWGRNLEGQAGVEGRLVVSRPTLLTELVECQPVSLAASERTSAVITSQGHLYTWGDGWGGKLGHGSGDCVPAPARVETLVGRTRVTRVALADHHTLLCDQEGRVWACGENKEGQCGLGTPMDVMSQINSATPTLARLHRQSPPAGEYLLVGPEQERGWHSDHPAQQGSYPSRTPQDNSLHYAAAQHHRSSHSRRHHSIQSSPGSPASHTHTPRAVPRRYSGAQERAVGDAAARRAVFRESLWSVHQHQTAVAAAGGGGVHASTSMQTVRAAVAAKKADRGIPWGPPTGSALGALVWGGVDLAGQLQSRGAQLGHVYLPARVGRDQHPLAQAALAGMLREQPGRWRSSLDVAVQTDVSMAPSLGLRPSAGPLEPRGIGGEVVLGVSARRHYSVAWDSRGQLWTWGACFRGALGPSNSWLTGAQKVDGQLAHMLEWEGGVVQAAAGGAFVVALCRSGAVVLWGTPPEPLPMSDMQPAAALRTDSGGNLVTGASKGRLAGARVPGVPAITQVAAGLQHALLTDGRRVWLVGQSLGPDGVDTDLNAPWTQPLEVLDTGADGVRCLSAGSHSSAVVTHSGQLYMWGHVMSDTQAKLVMKKHAERTKEDLELRRPDQCDWEWAGFGAASPTLVTGLPGPVRSVALGAWHALVMVD